MKRYNDLYNEITNIKNIIYIYENEIKKNTKNKFKIEKFENYLSLNIFNIYNELANQKVKFSNYYIFLIKEPKYRIIMSQTIKDKIINHLVARYFLLKVYEKSLLDSNIATRKGKGPLYGIKLLKRYINILKKEQKEIYYLKCDISKYFYNIDHVVLKNILRKKIKDKKSLELLDQIIDTTNNTYIKDKIEELCKREIEKISSLNISNKEKIKKIEEINKIPRFNIKGKGIPIGNMTSQAFAIIYLNDLDHYIKEKLNIKYYIRYMDDFVFLHTDKRKLKECYEIINKKLQDEFNLTLNPKTHIGMLKNGLDFLGYKFILKDNKLYLKLRTMIKRRFKKKLKKLSKLHRNQKIDSNVLDSVHASYYGHFKEGNTYCLYKKIIKKYGLKSFK